MGNAYSNMTDFWGQSFRIPPPPLTEKNLPDQTGKVFMITGGYAGVGAQLATILYQHNATVWIAGRSSSKAEACIQDIQSKHPDSKGHLHFLSVDLSDLTTIKPAVSKFLAEAKQLHWLNHNAGVMVPPPQSKGAQGMDLTYQTNILGPFLLTKLLLPILKSTAASSTPNTVRVSFAGSLAVVLQSPPGGVEWTTDGKDLAHGLNDPATSYGTSKAANFLFGREFPKHSGTEGVLFNSYNPGNLRTELQRHAEAAWPRAAIWLLDFLLYTAIHGAYTELYCGLSADLTTNKNQGAYVVPWGREWSVRADLEREASSEKGTGRRLWEWCEGVTAEFA